VYEFLEGAEGGGDSGFRWVMWKLDSANCKYRYNKTWI
jgi:hypothetical protein